MQIKRSIITLLTAAVVVLAGSWITPAAAAGAQEQVRGHRQAFAGRACVFNAPAAADGFGHAGWAVTDAAGHWYSGATEVKDNEHKPDVSWRRGPEDVMAMLQHFRTKRPATPYTRFRCRDVANPDPGNAVNKFSELAKQDYNLVTNNCLTRSMTTIKAYSDDAVTGLPGPGVGDGPNGYFEARLWQAGWENIVPL